MKPMLIKRVITHFVPLAASVGLFASMIAGGAAFAGDPAAGQKKAETCYGCHGIPDYVNIYPTFHVPKIGGQHEEYLIAALNAYRNKTRSHPTMQANALSLSEEDIADIAAYFASLK